MGLSLHPSGSGRRPEGVPDATLGPDRRGLLHDRSLDTTWSAAVRRAVLDGAVDSEGGDRDLRPESQWVVDEPDRARNLTDVVDGILKGKRCLIHDRDPLFTTEFL